LDLVENCKHPPMCLGVEAANIAAEAIRDVSFFNGWPPRRLNAIATQ
jgi:hypothetical protein